MSKQWVCLFPKKKKLDKCLKSLIIGFCRLLAEVIVKGATAKKCCQKNYLLTFGVKELVFSCEKKRKRNLRCCKLVFWLLAFSYFSVKWINKFWHRFLDKCFRSVIISLVCRSVLNHCSFARAAFSLQSVTTNSLLLHIFFTSHGVQYTGKIGSLIR